MVGESERGAVGSAVHVQSMADVDRLLGSRQSYSYLWDSLDVFFREGGGSAWVSRVGSAAATSATVDLETGGSPKKPTVTVTANAEGPWANDYTVDVAVAAGVITVTVSDADGNVVDTHGGATKADLIAYTGWQNVILTDADPTAEDPAPVTGATLEGGDDDRGGIVDADWATALAVFQNGLGPGQVLAPGRSDAAVQSALTQHAADHNRVALLDVPLTTDYGSIKNVGTTARAAGNTDYAAIFAPWVTVPGVVPNTVRTVPYSAAQAGLEARRDRISDPNVNIAAAGMDWPFAYVIGFTFDFTDADRWDLIQAGVNTGKMVYGSPETYGYRAVSTNPNWVQFNWARLRMALTAHGQVVGESYVFDQIDGQGLKAGEFASGIAGMLTDFYLAGALYGSSVAEAFRVDAGPSVNTPMTIANGELHAVAAVRMSPHAEEVVIEFVKTPITQAV